MGVSKGGQTTWLYWEKPQRCGDTDTPLKGQLAKQICSISWPVGLRFSSVQAKQIQWDPNLPGFLLSWSRGSHKIGSGGTGRLGGSARGWRHPYLLSFLGEIFLSKTRAQGARDQNKGGRWLWGPCPVELVMLPLWRWPLMPGPECTLRARHCANHFTNFIPWVLTTTWWVSPQ